MTFWGIKGLLARNVSMRSADIFDSTYGIPTIDPYTCDKMTFLLVFLCGMVSCKTLGAKALVKEDED